MHLSGTKSSTVDSIFVCRRIADHSEPGAEPLDLLTSAQRDLQLIQEAGVRISRGDVSSVVLGHATRLAISSCMACWKTEAPLAGRLEQARRAIAQVLAQYPLEETVQQIERWEREQCLLPLS